MRPPTSAGGSTSGPIGSIALVRTTTDDPRFRGLGAELDADMARRFSDTSLQLMPHDPVDGLPTAVIALAGDRAIGCGCLRPIEPTTVELKRMFVLAELRGRGIAARLVSALEDWARELGYARVAVEAYVLQRDVIALYRRLGYESIPAFGVYVGMATSVCLGRAL